MKSSLWIVLLFIAMHSLHAQPDVPADLAPAVREATTFGQLQRTITDYYLNKIATTVDSVSKKGYRRKMKHWNRYFWWNEHFVDAEGKVEDYNQKLFEAKKEQRREISTNNRYQTAVWEQDGPTYSVNNGAEGMGRADVIAFHPTNPNIVFAGTNNGGIFKSTNGGSSWFPLAEYLPSLGVAAICIHPTNTNIIYVLSGDRNGGGFISEYKYKALSKGVYKSTDGGSSWNKTADLPFSNFNPRDLIMDVENPSTLLAATSEGICKTTNSGNSWSVIMNGLNIWEMKYKPGSSTKVYAVGNNQFFLSTDGGDEFDEISVSGLNSASRISMAVTPDDESEIILLAGSEATKRMVGVFKSTDSGLNWDLIYESQEEDLFFNYIGPDSDEGQVTYNNTIAISPLDEDIVLVGGLCVWKSTDGGFTWEQATPYWQGLNFMHPDQHMLIFNAQGNVYAANDGGVYASFDEGDSWYFADDGLTATQFYHFELSNDEGDTWGGTQDNGVLEREGSGGGFYMFAFGDGYDVMTDHPWQVADGESDDIYYSINEYIFSDFENISVPDNQEYFGNLGMDPTDEDHIYVGYSNVYESFDAGDTWEVLSTGTGTWSLATCKSNADRLYFAGPGNGTSLLKRWDNGSETNLIGALIDSGFVDGHKITDIEVSTINSNILYISSAGFDEESKVFFSSNAGETWRNLTFNLPNVPVFSLVRDPTGGIYAGTYLGVYYKRSGIDYWEPFYNGLPPVPVTEMELYNFLNGVPQNIMISTFGRGLWKTQTYQSDCPNTISLVGAVDGLFYKDADILIQSNQDILDAAGTVVRYNAGIEIRLIPGFHAKGPGIFKTYLSGCGAEIDPD